MVGTPKVGLEGNSLSICGDRLINLSLIHESIAQIVVRIGKAGLEGDGLAIGNDRSIDLSRLSENKAHPVVEISIVGRCGDSAEKQIEGDVIALQLMRNHRQIMQGTEVCRLLIQYLPKKLLRIAQPPGFAVLQCQVERLLDLE